MTAPRYARLAARLLRASNVEAAPRADARERGMATIRRAMQRQRVLKRIRWATSAGLSLAASVALWLALRSPALVAPADDAGAALRALASSSGGAWVSTHEGRAALEGSAVLEGGALLSTTRHGAAEVQLSTGSKFRLHADTELQLARSLNDQRFVLSSGSVNAEVEHLEAGQRLVVITPDSEIEVIGTKFRLGVMDSAEACSDGLRTRLEVTEGVVEVRADARSWRVRQGQYWPADCAPATDDVPEAKASPTLSQEATLEPGAARESREGTRGSPDDTPTQHPAARSEPSSLREQTDLFARAAAAGRSGNTSTALRLYQELLSRFPHSALAENALVSRLRLLRSHDPKLAREAARGYLARHPRGFAREEAQQVLDAYEGRHGGE